MKILKDKLMLSCQKASELAEKKSLYSLTVSERLKLRLHNSMCEVCKTYTKQSQLIDNYLYNYFNKSSNDLHSISENKELKEKIIANINRQ